MIMQEYRKALFERIGDVARADYLAGRPCYHPTTTAHQLLSRFCPQGGYSRGFVAALRKAYTAAYELEHYQPKPEDIPGS